MFDLLVAIGLYTVLILLFVPLERIGKWQTAVRRQFKKITDKVS